VTLARELVAALRAAVRVPLPEDVALAARLHLLDACGVGLAAAGSPVGAAYRGLARELAKGGAATVFGQSAGAASADAALINGGLIHSLEFDDTHTGSIAHGSAVIAAAALAVGEAQRASGATLLGAFARGWEVLIRFGLASPTGFPSRGFQNTSVAGTLAAALVAAELLGLGEEQSVAALGISLSQASGVFEFLTNGSSVKSLHPGWAAHGGIIAALLARGGMTGPETSLEGRFGLYRQFAGDEAAPGRFRALIGDLGRRWHLPEAAYKFHPCCHYLHPFIEAAGVLADRGVGAGDAAGIVCRVPAGAAPIICDPWELKQAPETGHAARWSLPIAVAARLVEGKVDLATFESPAGAAVRELAGRIRWEPLPDARFPERFEAEIVCETNTGRTETVRIDDVYGNRTRPPGAEPILAKFRANAARSLPAPAIASVERAVEVLPAAPDLGALSSALRQVR
jgi:2-methylcitrate dehydratase PrpD